MPQFFNPLWFYFAIADIVALRNGRRPETITGYYRYRASR
jgi:hypothetical protein